ncbi:NAD(P)/FAD-dependent oxidoreductase [Nakamurella endophytica]|uniref:Oxidoreductase n=1 Tax=Nakamurella endophytica TaxID=1748367 RepID=A0A917SW77_9ACTN|nr:NAD(P)/FAD-dependent oxidoreductase [Nakamurella endophytica]GGL99346.1 oxidoreductase [Nakamurella endophytica]
MIDVLVVGAGPAGLATALAAERLGLSVSVLESRPAPIDKACGEGLMPGAVRALRELGVQVAGRPFAGIRYLDGRNLAEARFAGAPGAGVRRTELHDALMAAVAGRGIDVRQAAVGAVEQDGDTVRAGGSTARYLVAADGLHSPVRRSLGLDVPGGGPGRWGQRRHFAVRPWTDLVEVHWAAGAEAYVTPVGPDLVGVAVLSTDRGSFEDHLARFPQLVGRLAGAPSVGRVRGAGRLRQRSARRVAGRVLLVGDAAGYVDALTGEGIAVAVASASAAAGCLATGRPEDYEDRWRAATRRYRWLTETLLWSSSRPALRRTIVPAARRVPWLFGMAVRQLAG